MKLRNLKMLLAGAMTVATLANAAPEKKVGGYNDKTVVATIKVDGKDIKVTVADLKEIREIVPGKDGSKSIEGEDYEKLVRQAIDMQLMYAAAVKAGLLNREDVKAQVARCAKAMPQLAYRKDYIKNKMSETLKKEIYGRIASQFPRGEKSYSIKVIVLKDKKEAETTLKEIRAGKKKFEDVCKAKSIHPSKDWDPACTLPTLTRDDVPIELASKLIKAKSSTLIPTVTGIKSWDNDNRVATLYWVVYLNEVKKAEAPGINDPKVARLIAQVAVQKLTIDMIKGLRNDAKIEMLDLKGNKMEYNKAGGEKESAAAAAGAATPKAAAAPAA